MAAAIRVIRRASDRRTLAQTLTSIGLHFGVAFSVTWALTGQAVISGAVALIEPVLCHFAHQAHDAVWDRIPARTQPALVPALAARENLAA